MNNHEASTKDFTQKDLMQHLLNVAQHTATREDLADMRKEIDDKFDKVDAKFDKLDAKIDTNYHKLDAKLDKFTYIMVAGFLAVIALSVLKPLLATSS